MTRNGQVIELRKDWTPPKTAVQIGFAPQSGLQTVVVVGNLEDIEREVDAAIVGTKRFHHFTGAVAGSLLVLSRTVLEQAIVFSICQWFPDTPAMALPDGSTRPPVPAHYQPV